jgi:hypothetical protein
LPTRFWGEAEEAEPKRQSSKIVEASVPLFLVSSGNKPISSHHPFGIESATFSKYVHDEYISKRKEGREKYMLLYWIYVCKVERAIFGASKCLI